MADQRGPMLLRDDCKASPIQSFTEAQRLIDQALALLDSAGELDVTPYLDFAAHRLREKIKAAGTGTRNGSHTLDSSETFAGKLN